MCTVQRVRVKTVDTQRICTRVSNETKFVPLKIVQKQTSLNTIVFGLNLPLKLGSGLQCLVVVVDEGGRGDGVLFFSKSFVMLVFSLHTEFKHPMYPGTG